MKGMHSKDYYSKDFMERFREGHVKEFKNVYEPCLKEIFHFAYNLIGAQAEAEDIASETLTKLWKFRDRFKSLENIKAFLYITARNACFDYLRHLKRQGGPGNTLPLPEEVRDPVTADVAQDDAKAFCELSRRIEELPNRCREVVVLILSGNRTDEVAEKLQMSCRNVLNQKARAIKRLRSALLEKALLHDP